MTDDLPAEEALVDALAQSAFWVTGLLHEIGAEHDLSLTQMRVLGILRDRRLRMAGLADYLGLEKSTMSGLVDRAERRGLLLRERSAEDARVIEVTVTPEGARLAAHVHTQVRRAIAARTDQLAAGDRRTLTRILERLVVGPDA